MKRPLIMHEAMTPKALPAAPDSQEHLVGGDTMVDKAPIHPGTAPRDGIRTATTSTFGSLVLDAEGPVVVEFMSYGCPHCRVIEPVLQEVAKIVRSQEKIFRVNTAVESALAESYQVDETPTLIMFLKGREVGRVAGPSPTISSVLTAVTQAFEL
jgi:thioredoxin 1